MLVLTIKEGEKLYIGDNIVLLATAIGSKVKISVEAPKEIVILREKLKNNLDPTK